MLVYVLIMGKFEDGVWPKWDVFGLYSTKELAEEALEWRKSLRNDGLIQGCNEKEVYNKACIITRWMNYNLPIKEEP